MLCDFNDIFFSPSSACWLERAFKGPSGRETMHIAQELPTAPSREFPSRPKCPAPTLQEKKYFRAPFLVLHVVTNRGLYSVPGRTK